MAITVDSVRMMLKDLPAGMEILVVGPDGNQMETTQCGLARPLTGSDVFVFDGTVDERYMGGYTVAKFMFKCS